MTVRDPGYDPRRSPRRRGGSRPPEARPARTGWLLPAGAAGVLVLAVALGFGGGLFAGSAAPSPAGAASTAAGAASTTPAASSAAVLPSSPSPATPSAAPTAAPPAGTVQVAIVPVADFRSTLSGVDGADVKAIATGSGSLKALVLVEPDADAILAALGLDRAAFGKRLVTVATPDALAANLAANRTRLGFLRADDVRASVRALAWDGKALFGVGRVRLGAWPLNVKLAAAAGATDAYDPARSWTLVAGGDILLDRGVALAIKASRRGADFPFDGGTVEITGHCKDCSTRGWDLPYSRRTGNPGAVRDLVQGADLAIANFENPAPNAFRFHDHGTVFSANPAYIKGLQDAGLDWVSLANNHIGDAGRNGILQTMASLDRFGIEHSGAGKNTADAHKPALIDVGGVTVAMLGYDTIAPSYAAGPGTPGSAQMTRAALKADVAAARKAGADLVIVFPHWGVEYRAAPTTGQRTLAHAAIDAGADLVIGNHPHWAEGMEVYKGKPIWYALGNFVFDQVWSEYTMEGLTLELTFNGTVLVQARMRPHLILDRAQPNFLDPAGSGSFVMSQVYRASKGLLDW